MSEIILADSWVKATLDDLTFKITDGSHNPPPKQPEGLPMLSAQNVLNNQIVFDSYRLIEEKAFEEECKRANVEANDVLLTIVGTIGRASIVPENLPRFTLQRSVALIKPAIINSKWLTYYLQSRTCQNFFSSAEKGTAQKGVYLGTLKSLPIYLSPLTEQQRIVAKIEELFSELDKGIETLKTAQQQLKIYRQAVLKYAFEGKLTNPDVKEGELPEGWVIKALRNLTVKAEKVKLKDKNPDEEFLYLDIGAIDNQRNKFTGYKTYKWKEAPSRAQQIVHNKDVLFSTVRTYLKNIAQVNDTKLHGQICSSGFTVIRANEQTDVEYLFKYVLYEGFLAPLNELQTGTSYPAVRDEDVFSQEVCIPLNKELQAKVNDEIESRLSVCDKIEESIVQGLQQAEALRQSILKKAFEGKLVPQDPNDEPASVLLERIKAERAAAQPEKKSRSKKVK